MAARNKYTHEQKGAVLRSLHSNDGNVKRTAREHGLSPSTVKTWRDSWERHGVPAEIQAAAEEDAEQFLTDAARARDKALIQWEQKVDAGEVAARDLMTGVGVLTDKINNTKAVSKPKDDRPALDHAALREIARGVVEGAVSAARKREEEIELAEYEVIEQPTLNRGTS